MSLDLTGITVHNEYYSRHYLDALFENDLRGVIAQWEKTAADHPGEEAFRPPHARLRGLASPYFRAHNRLRRLRDPEAQLTIQMDFLSGLLHILGYTPQTHWRTLAQNGLRLPVLAEIDKPSGPPLLWVLPACWSADDPDTSPLSGCVDPRQYDTDPEQGNPGETGHMPSADTTWETIITRHVFSLDEPPRWILLVSFGQICLIDRTKWPEHRYLSFQISEIFNRRDDSTLKAMAGLLHRDSVCPAQGFSLLDTLDSNSHRHAFSVSESLKDAIRECVELLGNEAVYYLREKRREAVFSTPDQKLADRLTKGCLRYLYRLLFILYLEARPDLDYLPVKSETYLSGYSLESLRDMELVPLETDADQGGYFFDRSIRILFRLIFDGYAPKQDTLPGSSGSDDFIIAPLKSHLFDPAGTPYISKVRFRNYILQEIIQKLSLGRQGSGRHARSGRISYAMLGINQLGAVYENLLSYTGFFAKTDLFEVKPADAEYDPLQHAFFVPESELSSYPETERVYEKTNRDEPRRLLRHPKGKYVYRLAGRNREKSASYYTPESLTQCVVAYSLKELLKEKSADDILNLTVCEMAVGSAAFLNQAVDQLADAYLMAKQKETGQTIAHDAFKFEKMRVKMRLADNNVFGVDLNPTAVELAEISLWLNTIHAGAHVPWFGLQLANGNSLIGCRRQTWPAALLEKMSGRGGDRARWTESVPDPVPWSPHLSSSGMIASLPGSVPTPPPIGGRSGGGYDRPADAIYHWLVPDPGMSVYNDRVVRDLKPSDIKAIAAWRKTFCKAFDRHDIQTLKQLSRAADALWNRHLADIVILGRKTSDAIPVWPDPIPQTLSAMTTTQYKDQQMVKTLRHPGSPYRRLQLAMDYWCALWFWPIEQARLLPTRDQFLMEMSVLLGAVPTLVSHPGPPEQTHMFVEVSGTPVQLELDFNTDDPSGIVNVDTLCSQLERLKLVREIAEKRRFFHWELEFADVFARRGGFDLIVGNPPWVKIEWNEAGLLSERNPAFAIRGLTAPQVARLREQELEKEGVLADYLSEYEEFEGAQNFLNALQNYPLLKGQQTNLYKCFITRAWDLLNPNGAAGFLHPEGVYDDPNGGPLRRELYPRLRYHFQYQNELQLFAEVDHHAKFSINIYHEHSNRVQFQHIANLFSVGTVDMCFEHAGLGQITGIKGDDGQWATNGHKDRIIPVDETVLSLFARLYDVSGTSAREARLPALHARQLVAVLQKFADFPNQLGDMAGQYLAMEMWHETNAQKEGTIRRETQFPDSPEQLILSGPHFFVGNPLNKTPREVCTKNSHYDVLDLETLPDDYLSRTNYVPDCDMAEYRRRTPTVPWGDNALVTKHYRLIFRGMLSQSGERTLIGAILSKEATHIHGALSVTFQNSIDLLLATAISSSIISDFFIKTTGSANLHFKWNSLPLLKNNLSVSNRVLALNCLTTHYADLWAECWNNAFQNQRWFGDDPRLDPDFWRNLTPQWQRNCALRTDFSRRWALVELDVLAARTLALTLAELQTIYRIQFPVLRQYEADTWYDQKGRIVFTCSKGLPGVGFSRPEWEPIKNMPSGTVTRTVTDNTLPTGPVTRTIVYHAPFTRCDRERDYAMVWDKLRNME